MKGKLLKILIFLATFLLFTGNCYAFNNFRCIVKESYSLEDDGKLSSKTEVAKVKLNKEFIVNRQTGQITGDGFVNTMSGQMPVVYDYLPMENGYKAITIYKPNHTVDYLQINEFVKEMEKPFFYKGAWGEIITGLCTYY
jgi:hypothetical protein